MRRLLLAAAAIPLTLPATPAQAGPAACVVTAGFPVCAGRCAAGDPITVRAIGSGITSGTASCGGGTASCTVFRATCTDTGTASGSGTLTCSGSAQVVICLVGLSPR